jgi:hypothetical protein
VGCVKTLEGGTIGRRGRRHPAETRAARR